MLGDFLRFLVIVRPRTAVLENVHGFVLPESRDDPESPLKRLLSAAAELIPTYTVVPFLMPGNTFMHFIRRRVFVAFIDEGVGGSLAMDRMKRFVTEQCLHVHVHQK